VTRRKTTRRPSHRRRPQRQRRRQAQPSGWLAGLAALLAIAGIIFWQMRLAPVPEAARRVKPAVKAARRPVPSPAPVRVAIVLDDFGYSEQNVSALEQLRYPVTCAVLPNLPYSALVAEAAQRSGHEVILHMPMEPHQPSGASKRKLERGTIYTSMKPEQVRRQLDEAIASVPHLRGVSNHMGSRATEDPQLMRTVASRLKSRHLYFLDSFVTEQSVAMEQARQAGVPCARRDIFLDNKLDETYIIVQLDQLVTVAREGGVAIGIGHDRPSTLRVLRRQMPRYVRNGVTFVKVSELVR